MKGGITSSIDSLLEIFLIIIYLTYHMFLQGKLKSIKLTKLINILLHNDKKLLYTSYFFVNHGASSSRNLSRRSL